MFGQGSLATKTKRDPNYHQRGSRMGGDKTAKLQRSALLKIFWGFLPAPCSVQRMQKKKQTNKLVNKLLWFYLFVPRGNLLFELHECNLFCLNAPATLDLGISSLRLNPQSASAHLWLVWVDDLKSKEIALWTLKICFKARVLHQMQPRVRNISCGWCW